MRTREKLALLTSLYLSQGLPFGFFSQAVPILMRQKGMSLPDVSKAVWLMAPWALKFLWAPLVDRWGWRRLGRRRSWILPLQVASIALAACLWRLGTAGVPTMMAALFVTNLISATQDIATDGLAVELLAEGERGYGNSVQVAAYRAGMILGGGLLLYAYDRLGPPVSFITMAAILAVATVPIALHREAPPPPSATAASSPPGLGAWIAVARRPGMGAWLAVLVVYKGGEALAYGMVKPLFVDHGFSIGDIGMLLGTVGFFAGLVGAVLGGALVNRAGRARALIVAGVLQLAGILSYVAPATGLGGAGALAAASVLEHLTGGIATVSLFTVMMDACTDAAGTEYTLQASVVVIATGVAQAGSGFIAARLGYAGHFLVGAAVSALGLAFTGWALARTSVRALIPALGPQIVDAPRSHPSS